MPTKSGIIGMLAAALGRRREHFKCTSTSVSSYRITPAHAGNTKGRNPAFQSG